MKKLQFAFIVALLMLANVSFAQTPDRVDQVFLVVEEDPEYPGGPEALYQFIAENMRYPQEAKERGITGRVFVTFVVEKDGSTGDIKVLRDIGGGCGEEAVRVVGMMPKWKPGKQQGEPVRTQFNLPVVFNLSEQESSANADFAQTPDEVDEVLDVIEEEPMFPAGLFNLSEPKSSANEASAQTLDRVDQVFLVVEEDPQYPGGREAMSQFLAKNIRYPQEAKERGITGRVFVTFVVEKDGSVGNIKVLRDIGGGCGEEAVRVVGMMPKWKPGKQLGKPVRTQYNLPVVFNLSEQESN